MPSSVFASDGTSYAAVFISEFVAARNTKQGVVQTLFRMSPKLFLTAIAKKERAENLQQNTALVVVP